MRLLIYDSDSFNADLLMQHIEHMGHTAFMFNQVCKDYNSDMNLATKLFELVHANNLDGIITFNYFPIVATACNACSIEYYSWIYDSPHLTLFSKSVYYPTNHIGCFDRELVDELIRNGVDTVRHIPLGCDIHDMADRISSQTKRFDNLPNDILCDVSFVGSLYTDTRKVNFFDSYERSADTNNTQEMMIWQSLNNEVMGQCFNYNKDFLSDNPAIDYAYLYRRMLEEGSTLGADYFISPQKLVTASILEKKVTSNERDILMNAIASHCFNKYDFRLFTTSDTSGSDELNTSNHGPVDYYTEMPKVFASSRINIHNTLKSIKSGIPLRVLDILSCGGFLLCDPQEEIVENFSDGIDLAIYHSPEECIDKIDYYLSHEDIRKRIALNGKEKVSLLFDYTKMLGILLNS